MDKIYIPGEWKSVADQIKSDTKICIIIGKNDSGKSTFCKFLVHYWTSSRIRVGYVDSDLGQSTIGLPTTVSVKVFNAPPRSVNHFDFTALHFVGNTSPVGFLLQTLNATRLMVDKSYQHNAGITLVDTTGFIEGPVARTLKFHKIEMLRPQRIIALQADNEAEHLLKGYEKMGWRVTRLIRSKYVVAKSYSERQDYRAQKYKAYFKAARVKQCPLDNVVFPACILGTGKRVYSDELPEEFYTKTISYMEKCGSELLVVADRFDTSVPFCKLKKMFGVTSIVWISRSDLRNLLVGLNDKDNSTLGLGIITDLDPISKKLALFTPVQDIHEIATVHLGGLKIEKGERENGKIRVIQYV
ncbi:MAG: hypothetical protein E3K32_12165 [wastewater metagenome]|nr:hypothetical protein [Candidatus Loosdrechtia aerotolerans]